MKVYEEYRINFSEIQDPQLEDLITGLKARFRTTMSSHKGLNGLQKLLAVAVWFGTLGIVVPYRKRVVSVELTASHLRFTMGFPDIKAACVISTMAGLPTFWPQVLQLLADRQVLSTKLLSVSRQQLGQSTYGDEGAVSLFEPPTSKPKAKPRPRKK